MTMYVRAQASANRMLAKYGQLILVTRVTPGEYDPETSTNGESTTTTQTLNIAVLPASQGTVEAFDIKFEKGTLISSNIRSLIISAVADFAPMPGDMVTFEGSDWTLIGVTPLNPGGTAVLYTGTAKR